MDGVPFVTQCPILPGNSYVICKIKVKEFIFMLYNFRFMYSFEARTSGTMFYHSHSSFQRADGLIGAYIVRQAPGNDPNDQLYDFDLTEHVIFPQEWFHQVRNH